MSTLNTLGLNSLIGAQFTDSEFETLVDIIYLNSKNKEVSKRAKSTIESNKVWQHFQTTGLGKQLTKTELYGDYKDIYLKAYETEFKPTNSIDLEVQNGIVKMEQILAENSTNIKEFEANRVSAEEMKLVADIKIEDKGNGTYSKYKRAFRAFENYGSVLIGIYRTIRRNGNGYEEKTFTFEFAHKGAKAWRLELPAINPQGRFIKNNSEYIFMFMPKNLENYSKGVDDYLELSHPFEYISEKLLEVYVDPETGLPQYLAQDFFDKRVEYTNKNGRIKKFQDKLNRILMNAKEHYWDERDDSPIVWIDKNSSTLAKSMFENNVAIFAKYDMLVENGLIKGLDLLTGSTSTPAKRCKIANGWEMKYINQKLVVAPKENISELSNYLTDYKFSNPGTFRTSSKRDNSCTVRSTYNLVNPQTYNKRVKISVR